MKHTIYKSFGTFAATASLLTASSMAGTEPAPAPPVMEPAPSPMIEGEVGLSYSNMYEFRYVDQGNDMVTASVDLAYDTGMFALRAGAWYATWDGAPTGLVNNTEELDLYAGIGYDVTDDFSVEVGHISYIFFDGSGDTNEVYVSAEYQLPVEGLSLASTYYWDWDINNGQYVEASVNYSYSIMDDLGLDLAVGTAYNHGNGLQVSTSPAGGTEDGLQGYFVSAALPWTVRDNVTLTPYIKYTDAESGLVTNTGAVAENGGEHIIAGVSLAVGF